MQDPWTHRLSEYLDEELDREERDRLEEHLGICPECASILAGLRQVRARARDLKDAAPPPSLWARIEAGILARRTVPFPGSRIEPEHAAEPYFARGRRFSFSIPQLVAACLAVALVSGGAVFGLLKNPKRPATAPVPSLSGAPESGTMSAPERGTSPPAQAEPASLGAVSPKGSLESPHEEAIAELRKALARERDRLDPATIRTLESNLAIIDLAIDQAKRALAADPANTYVKEHLADTMRRKVELLQRATMLASSSTSEGSR